VRQNKQASVVLAVVTFLGLGMAIGAGTGHVVSQTVYLPFAANHAVPSTPTTTQTGTLPATPTPTSTPTVTPTHGVPPFIYIEAPSEAYVGNTVVLDA
jgi:hypothetical protein